MVFVISKPFCFFNISIPPKLNCSFINLKGTPTILQVYLQKASNLVINVFVMLIPFCLEREQFFLNQNDLVSGVCV